jgi:hypothetical protein
MRDCTPRLSETPLASGRQVAGVEVSRTHLRVEAFIDIAIDGDGAVGCEGLTVSTSKSSPPKKWHDEVPTTFSARDPSGP